MGRHRKDPKIVEEMYDSYLSGKTLKEVADDYGCSRQAVYHLFKTNGMNTRVNGIKHPCLEFNGRKYTKTAREPNNYCRIEGNHSTIQRDIWEFYNGKVPSGCVVYHIDGNKENNDIENLKCVSRSEYFKKNITPIPRWKDHRFVEEMHMYYKDGNSYREVARRYDIKSSSYLATMFINHGLEPKKERAMQWFIFSS